MGNENSGLAALDQFNTLAQYTFGPIASGANWAIQSVLKTNLSNPYFVGGVSSLFTGVTIGQELVFPT